MPVSCIGFYLLGARWRLYENQNDEIKGEMKMISLIVHSPNLREEIRFPLPMRNCN
jgi:hypothetical protein